MPKHTVAERLKNRKSLSIEEQAKELRSQGILAKEVLFRSETKKDKESQKSLQKRLEDAELGNKAKNKRRFIK